MAEDSEKNEQGKAGKAQDQKHDGKETAQNGKAGDALTLLKNDHRTVEQLFAQFEQASRRSEKAKLAQQVCQELIIHAMIEEEIFYPACREHVDDDMLDEAQVEHDSAKTLINEILSGSPEAPFFDAKVKVLSEQIKHHVQEEEKGADSIFAKAKAGGLDVDALGQKLAARKQELLRQAQEEGLERPRPRSFRTSQATRMEERMAQSQYRDRDDRGRFMSEDDRRYAARGNGGRSRYDDDDDRRSNRGQFRERDEYGRFMSDDDRGGSRFRSRYDDDDDRRGRAMGARGGGRSRYDDDDDGRGHGRGGWFGDPQGHSEASRRGWRMSDHEGSGWYGDPEGHSEASRRGWRTSDHEGSGWFGDPEGHSEASRRGWEARGRFRSRYDDDDDRRGRSMSSRGGGRSRYEDDEDRGQGGWFGDPRGHSEAARRGWENRR